MLNDIVSFLKVLIIPLCEIPNPGNETRVGAAVFLMIVIIIQRYAGVCRPRSESVWIVQNELYGRIPVTLRGAGIGDHLSDVRLVHRHGVGPGEPLADVAGGDPPDGGPRDCGCVHPSRGGFPPGHGGDEAVAALPLGAPDVGGHSASASAATATSASFAFGTVGTSVAIRIVAEKVVEDHRRD